MLITPFEISGAGYLRNASGTAKVRKNQWDYLFVKSPYFLNLNIHLRDLEAIYPLIQFKASEKGEKLSFLSSSPY
jgi:hypothetical protein